MFSGKWSVYFSLSYWNSSVCGGHTHNPSHPLYTFGNLSCYLCILVKSAYHWTHNRGGHVCLSHCCGCMFHFHKSSAGLVGVW